MGFYPLLVDLSGRRCVVIGGGAVGEQKANGVLAAGAEVTIVSPELTPALGALRETARIHHVARPYRHGDLVGATLAFTAVRDRAVTAAVAEEARERGVWLNAADDPTYCTFILPAVLRRGLMTVAVASGGASPAMTRALRDHLEALLGSEWATLAELAAEARRDLRAAGSPVAGAAWRRALAPDVRALIVADRVGEARDVLRARLGTPA